MKNRTLKPSGFTLTELLVVIVIISMLAAISLGGLAVVRNKSNIDRTRRTVQKIHFLLMEKLESYQTRRVKVDKTNNVPEMIERVGKMYHLMRMEMPDRESDLFQFTPGGSTKVTAFLPQKTGAAERIARKYFNRDIDNEDSTKDAPSAEFLYMIIMNMPNAAEQFAEYEIDDVDGDGLKEFVDAWGNPIKFLRWPVGFTPDKGATTDLQAFDCTYPADPKMYDPLKLYDPNDPNDEHKSAPLDSLDSRGVVKYLFPTTASFPVYPLVYSAGPDKKYDINLGWESPPSTRSGYFPMQSISFKRPDESIGPIFMINPFASDTLGNKVGQPLDETNYNTDDLDHDDNITNHVLDFGKASGE